MRLIRGVLAQRHNTQAVSSVYTDNFQEYTAGSIGGQGG